MATTIPDVVPDTEIWWGDLYRSGYHEGIDRVRDFYTRRNLIVLGELWEGIEHSDEDLRDALRLLVLSYNATHSTLMTRVVVKKGQSDFVLTGAQSGVMYVSSLPVEKNVLVGVERKAKTFQRAFDLASGGSSQVTVVNGSSTALDLPSESVDYMFTDPPFGGFIPYAEINQLNEAWLGAMTERADEAITSPAQGKGIDEYATLMKQVFAEAARVLKRDALATVVFHSSKPDVWGAVADAITSSGLRVATSTLLDKTQPTFKQVVSAGGTRGDAVFLLDAGEREAGQVPRPSVDQIVIDLRRAHGSDTSPQHLYSRYVSLCLEQGWPVEVPAGDFYRVVADIERQGVT